MVKKDILNTNWFQIMLFCRNLKLKSTKKLDIHPEQLPKIKADDPVVKTIEAKPGIFLR